MKRCSPGIMAAFVLMLLAGCPQGNPLPVDKDGAMLASGCVYGVEGIRVVGLTTLRLGRESIAGSQLQIYLDLVDSFGSRIKAPGKIRFELYEFVSRSGQPMGKRLFMWPDIVLFDAQKNNEYWQDYLRSYVFDLQTDFRVVGGAEYVLQATWLTGDGKRITDTYQVKAEN